MLDEPITPDDAPKKRNPRWIVRIAGLTVLAVVVIGSVVFFARGAADSTDRGTTFVVQRGDLNITVTEGGSVEAQESQEIRSEIEGREGTKILKIVEEGYEVTPEDVENGLVLVELDSAQLENDLVNQEIAYQSAEANHLEEVAEYEIQLNQNQSNIKQAELTAKFALMDFQKFLGKAAVNEILNELGIDKETHTFTKPVTPGDLLDEPDGEVEADAEPETTSLDRTKPIPMTDELMEAITNALSEKGMPVQPERFRQMARGRGGFGGNGGDRRSSDGDFGGEFQPPPGGFPSGPRGEGGMLSPRMAERMQEMMGIDVYELAESIGITGEPESAEPVEIEPAKKDEVLIQASSEYMRARDSIDFTKYADVEKLEDGEAKQMLRELGDAVSLASEELLLAKTRLEGQRRLAEKDFITQNDLDLEEVKLQRAQVAEQSAIAELEMYNIYDFPKQAEQLLSDYEEALMALERTRQEAMARMSQERARMKRTEVTYNLEAEKLEDLKEQIQKSVIRAERTGLVVYGSSTENNPWRRSNQDPIQEGATVRERQLILTIPDMTKMAVRVNIHESAVKRVAKGQTAEIVVDAFPGRTLTGKVNKVAVLADSANMFVNPDLKVYPTVVEIEGTHSWLRPGMSAQAEILIERLEDVLYIPIQAVFNSDGQRVVYVMENGQTVKRRVETGGFTEEFIEIKSGLKEGEIVRLLPPDPALREKLELKSLEAEPAPEQPSET